MTLLGNFSDEAFDEYQKLISEKQEVDFSEGDSYDFTRCMRPNGTFYGTGGKCKSGSEAGARESKAATASGSGRSRPKAAIDADMRKLTSSGAMQQKGIAGIKARAEHARLKAESRKPLPTRETSDKAKGTRNPDGTLRRPTKGG